MQIFKEANGYVILDNSTIYLLPKEEKPVCFYEPPNSYEVQEQEDSTLVISKRMPLKQAIERVERAGVDDPCEVLDRLVQGGKCTVTIE